MRKLRTIVGTSTSITAAFIGLSLCSAGWAQTHVTSAAILVAKNQELKAQLANNQFGRPLILESSESASIVEGNVYAVLDSPFVAVSRTFKSPQRWCDVMILHINTKYCHAAQSTAPTRLDVSIGRKTQQQRRDAFALDFDYELIAASPDYFSILLSAKKGPLGTSDYRIELQAVPLPDNRTFMRLRYAYGYGVASRVVMQGYLATAGRGKVGFTRIGQGTETAFVGGMRGAAERNIMRYYLAIEAYQASLDRPQAERLEASLQHWFSATEQYPQQLHEVEKSSYMTMKRVEYERQQSAEPQN